MTPTEMEIRVATAIYDNKFGSYASLAASDEEFAKYIKQARAAIQAMREPTWKMQHDGDNHLQTMILDDKTPTDEWTIKTWQAMINAASPTVDGDK